ncbi:glutathione S-transferase family protein [Romeria aff. gracilis LEGE 07310]|uniref:Glutathione S-transferase family protein n=1 Tax=Vasconcelosia minhoensis LEGE 07310 TaxID=915328 RepID=A0A8J7DQE4_9CYAN|nr:glutathione S-transferase family protein [Romeria gracilis]MBE9076429.1 glutathione S-transferase family protein [Romeria aff. gracilis LEGE 07310]
MPANPLTKLTQRASLPPGLIVRTGKFVWSTMWHLMMSQLAPRQKSGAYVRPESQFRDRVSPDAAQPGRYRLIVGMGCPWAHRTLITRALKGLEAAIPITTVSPSGEQGIWVFDQPLLNCQTLPEFYARMQSGYAGRATVPVLWDAEAETIVNNESAEIIEILNAAFNSLANNPDLDLYPAAQQAEIDAWNDKIYRTVNNGVYRCGFAQTQAAYQDAFTELFSTLDEVDQALASHRYLCGEALTLADVRLFTTLIRFDVAYYGLFKCNRRRIQDYPQLSGYLRDIYQQPGIAETCDVEAVKRDYYGNLFPLNPGGLIPLGPELEDWNQPPGREALAAAGQHHG